MAPWQIVIIFAVGLALAFPLAVLLVVALGWPLLKLRQLLNPCPKCGGRTLQWVSGLRCHNPPSFYLCGRCGTRFKRQGGKWSEATTNELKFFNRIASNT
jgi:hypothetical protein